MKAIGYTVTFFAGVFINAMLNGYALSILWTWFIASTFGLPVISIPTAIGITLTAGMFYPIESTNKNSSVEFLKLMLEVFLRVVIRTVLAISTGWTVLQFI